MGLLRRIVPALLGAAAGCAALYLVQQYQQENVHEHLEGPVEHSAEAPKTVPVSSAANASSAFASSASPTAKHDVTKLITAADFPDLEDCECKG